MCGINAYATPAGLVPEGSTLEAKFSDTEARPLLLGVVALSGKVVEHEDGYRAERALVTGLVRFEPMRVYETSEPRLIRLEFRTARRDFTKHWTFVRYPSVEFAEWKGPPHREVVADTLAELGARTRRPLAVRPQEEPA
jgi:hypothetical protein